MKSRKIEFKWAIIFVLMGLVWMVLERLMGLHDEHIDKHATYTNFVAIPAIAIYVFALLDKRQNDYGGFMTYGQGFISGLVITLIVTILSPLSQVITSLIITPDYFDYAIDHAVKSGGMERDAAGDYFTLKNYIVQGLIGAPIMGLLTTAVVAIFTKKSSK